MNRTIGIERVYNLGNFNSIRFTDSLEFDGSIDQVLFSILEDKIRKLQLVETEIAYNNNYILHNTEEEAYSKLNTELYEKRLELISEIKTIFMNK